MSRSPPNDFAGLRKFARENQIDLTVVGPDDPLAAGLVDEFHEGQPPHFRSRAKQPPGSSLRKFSPNN